MADTPPKFVLLHVFLPSYLRHAKLAWFPPPFQWPGYGPWERQIQIREQTRRRNEITLERFTKLAAGVVDRFLTVKPCRGLGDIVPYANALVSM